MAKHEQYNVHYLGFRDNSNRLIGASLMLYKTLFWGYKYAYAPRGFLIDYDNDKLIDTVTQELKNLLRKQNRCRDPFCREKSGRGVCSNTA